jgi:hypothetical protein
MLQTQTRSYLTLSQVAARAGCHSTTAGRWITRGTAIGGVTYRLRGVRFPQGWKILEEDFDAFLAELTAAALGQSDPSGTPDPSGSPHTMTKSQARESARIDNELDRLGV